MVRPTDRRRPALIIDQDVADALNTHMGRELAAHVQYLAISAWFAEEGLPELSRLFAAQAAEEHMHGMKFYQYIIDAGAPLRLPAIEAPKPTFESADEAVGLALDQELAVTRQINEIADLAASRRDHATQVFLQWFITEQVEEVATMTELRQMVRRAGETHLLLVEEYAARRMASAGAPGPGAGPAG